MRRSVWLSLILAPLLAACGAARTQPEAPPPPTASAEPDGSGGAASAPAAVGDSTPPQPETEGCAEGNVRDYITALGDDAVRLDPRVSTLFGEGCEANPDDPRLVPYYVNGELSGYRWFALRADNVWWALGVRMGDVLVSVDGEPAAPRSPAELFAHALARGETTLGLERRGEPMTLRIEVRATR